MHNFYDALPSMPAVGLQRGMDLWGDDAAFCQITLTSCSVIQTILGLTGLATCMR